MYGEDYFEHSEFDMHPTQTAYVTVAPLPVAPLSVAPLPVAPLPVAVKTGSSRAVSSKKDANGNPLSYTALLQKVKAIMANLPRQFQVKDLKSKSMRELEIIRDQADHHMSVASISAQHQAAVWHCTASVQQIAFDLT